VQCPVCFCRFDYNLNWPVGWSQKYNAADASVTVSHYSVEAEDWGSDEKFKVLEMASFDTEMMKWWWVMCGRRGEGKEDYSSMAWLVKSVWIRSCIHVNPKCWITWISKHARQEKNGQLCVECTSGHGSQLTCVQYSIGEFEGRVCIWTNHKSEELLKECTLGHVQNYITLQFLTLQAIMLNLFRAACLPAQCGEHKY